MFDKTKKKEERSANYPIHWRSTYLMLGSVSIEKYVDHGIPIVAIYINNIPLLNTLIDLGVALNVMTKGTM